MPSRPKIFLILVAILIVAGFASSFFYWSKNVRPKDVPPIMSDSPVADICGSWDNEGKTNEISCEKAIELSLSRYPGKAEYANRVALSGEEILAEVGVKPDSPIVLGNLSKEFDRIKVIINVQTSEIISVRPGRGL